MKLRSPIPQKKARLEIIPLIDIMFFLLASFMLVSLTMAKQQTIKVSLPTATTAKTDFKPDMINLAVDASGNYFMDTNRMTLPDLEKALFEKFRANAETPVYISGDANARHGSMVQVLDTVRRVGFQKVAFQTKAPDIAKATGAPATPAAPGAASPAAPAPASSAAPAPAPTPAPAPAQ
ncbi:outer membrane transport energization protein ExbD [Roseimicrobium gellanilyticum]|uniref:Outer membrane transport energization protein ExbD n=1 Tax=Roseimicrobium gellanilyticum TaxID=748857 RepID=A0A366HSD5_9BACT|nr:biopolymer transporter ExbD [Roseimicrobium gellanilyticum]RBP46008.1 outer membrane transport energization protein ExbD [Roseimicrobium gellanilyticum]